MFQSTLPVWGATNHAGSMPESCRVSIHAPRVGSDGCKSNLTRDHHGFNPRSPCGERHLARLALKAAFLFQSTLPVWGATHLHQDRPRTPHRFNPRSPCGERRLLRACALSLSICFNPRSPCGERRLARVTSGAPFCVSIHAPRVGSDAVRDVHRALKVDVSIHAPRVGSDKSCPASPSPPSLFQSTLPCGERRSRACRAALGDCFNPRSPCGERRHQLQRSRH